MAMLLALMVIPVTGGTQEGTGKRVYEANCAVCHGNNAEGEQDLRWYHFATTTRASLRSCATAAPKCPRSPAPGYGDTELAAVAEYLRSLGAERESPCHQQALGDQPEPGPQRRCLRPQTDWCRSRTPLLANPDPADWLSWRRTLDGHGKQSTRPDQCPECARPQAGVVLGMDAGISQTTRWCTTAPCMLPVRQCDPRARRPYGAAPMGVPARRERPAGSDAELAIYQDLVYLNTGEAISSPWTRGREPCDGTPNPRQ